MKALFSRVRARRAGPLAAPLIALLTACGGPDPDPETGARSRAPAVPDRLVYATFYPVAYFARRVGGDAVEVVLPLPAETDPALWRPPADVLLKYQQAELVVANGAGFERWLDTAALPESRLVRSAAPLEDDLLRYEEATTHTHGPGGEHTHEGIDGHTWLDPRNAMRQAAAIRDALEGLAPGLRERFQANYRQLADDLETLHESLIQHTQRADPPPVLASHPAYNYLARRYGWNLKNLDLDPGTVPTAEQLHGLGHLLDGHPADFIIWESDPDPDVDQLLEERFGLRSVVFRPAEHLPPDRAAAGDDYLDLMTENIEALRPVFAE